MNARPEIGRTIELSGRNTYNYYEPVTITGTLTYWPPSGSGLTVGIDGRKTSVAVFDVTGWRYV